MALMADVYVLSMLCHFVISFDVFLVVPSVFQFGFYFLLLFTHSALSFLKFGVFLSFQFVSLLPHCSIFRVLEAWPGFPCVPATFLFDGCSFSVFFQFCFYFRLLFTHSALSFQKLGVFLAFYLSVGCVIAQLDPCFTIMSQSQPWSRSQEANKGKGI